LTREDLLSHHQLISELFLGAESILPARFPTFAADADALADRLRSNQDSLVGQLQRVRGCCEFAVTALWTAENAPSTPPHPGTPGRRYMVERQLAFAGSDRRRARAKRLASEIEHLVEPDLISVRHTVCPSVAVGLSSALLVKRSRAASVRARLVCTEQDVRILVNGPWPPYTFAAVGSN
jgi:hypothetical protein